MKARLLTLVVGAGLILSSTARPYDAVDNGPRINAPANVTQVNYTGDVCLNEQQLLANFNGVDVFGVEGDQLQDDPPYSWQPVTSGQPISPEMVYKTLIYAYAWGRSVWLDATEDRRKFEPPNVYGLKLTVRTSTRHMFESSFIAFLPDEMVRDFQSSGHWLEFTAVVLLNGEPFAAVSLQRSPPSPLVLSLPTEGSLTSRVSWKGTESVNRPRDQQLQKRANSPKGFDDSVKTGLASSGPFVVQNIEPPLMATLIHLARLAFSHEQGESYVSRVRSGIVIIASRAAGWSRSLEGKDVLDSLIDTVEWIYAQHDVKGLFFKPLVSIQRELSGGLIERSGIMIFYC